MGSVNQATGTVKFEDCLRGQDFSLCTGAIVVTTLAQDQFQYCLGVWIGPGGGAVVIFTSLGPNSKLLGSMHWWYQITAVM